MRRTVLPMLRLSRRSGFSTTTPAATSWSPGPAPPRLPKEEQDKYEELLRQSTGAFSTPRQTPQINQSPQSRPQINQSPHSATSDAAAGAADTVAATSQADTDASKQPIKANVQKGDELHPNVRRGAPPEFEGDTNPLTGEVGGPKQNPTRWGGEVDWSYNGRVTDF